MKENEIGQSHALFYIAHATFLELRGNYSGADNVYQQGINRLAAPQDRLRAKFDEFQHRMVRRIQRKAQEQSVSAAEESRRVERPSLAVLGGRRSVRSAGLQPSSQKRKAVATPGKGNAPAAGGGGGGGGLGVFVDEEFGGPAALGTAGGAGPSSATAAPSSSRSGAAGWSSLPSFEQTRKENTQKASSWAGQRIKQTSTYAAAPPAPALDIPLDPEFKEEEAECARRAADAEAQHVSLRQRLDRGSGLDEALLHDPMRFHRQPPAVVAFSAPAAITTTAAAAAAPKTPREEILACNKDTLHGEDGEEVSFEELRAKQWLQHNNKLKAAVVEGDGGGDDDVEMEIDDDEEESEPCAPSPITVAPVVVETTTTTTTFPSEAAAATLKATPFDRQLSKLSAPASLAALNDQQQQQPPPPLMEDGTASSEMTMTTRDAFDAINAAFGGRFGGDAPVLAADDLMAAGMDPTMTISTEEAFAAINSMFANKVRTFINKLSFCCSYNTFL